MWERREALFWLKVQKTAHCWVWAASKDKDGYGWFVFPEASETKAHRASWILANGQMIPDGSLVLHSCDNPSCVRPSHLSLGSHADNSKQMLSRNRRDGLRYNRGESHPKVKLSREDVTYIRLLSAGGVSQRELARRYSVSRSAVRYVLQPGAWS